MSEITKLRMGKCLWFDVQKGFGFIKQELGGPDVFVHYSMIIAEPGEFRLLEENDEVEYELYLADHGNSQKLQARNVKLIGKGSGNEVFSKKRNSSVRRHFDRS